MRGGKHAENLCASACGTGFGPCARIPPLLKAQPSSDAAGPKPAQILTARTIFVSNPSAECPSFYCASPDQPYNPFYASMKSWGRYELMASPGGSRLDLRNTFLPWPAW